LNRYKCCGKLISEHLALNIVKTGQEMGICPFFGKNWTDGKRGNTGILSE
jgi:hypothetical protein